MPGFIVSKRAEKLSLKQLHARRRSHEIVEDVEQSDDYTKSIRAELLTRRWRRRKLKAKINYYMTSLAWILKRLRVEDVA